MPDYRPDHLPDPTSGVTPDVTAGVAPGDGLDAEPAPSPRERLLASIRHPFSRGQMLAALVLGVVGFAAIVQMQANDRSDRYAGATEADLIALISSQEAAQERVESQIRSLEQTRDSLLDNAATSDAATELARQRAASLSVLAGTVPTVGPGVLIRVDGPAGSIGTEILVNGIQELRSAGAEAIEINGEVRVVGRSSIQAGVEDSVFIDGVRLTAPYTLRAIGSPIGLEQAVGFPGGFRDSVEDAGGTFEVEQQTRIEILTVRETAAPRYATPAPAG